MTQHVCHGTRFELPYNSARALANYYHKESSVGCSSCRPNSHSNYGSVQPCGSSVVYSECPLLILLFPSSNLIKIRNTSTMQTVSWHAEWLLSLSVWSRFNMIWMQVYIFLIFLPLSLTQILNGIRKYLLIRPKTKKNFGKANIKTATRNFLGGTL